MKIINKIISLLITISIALCVDLIFNYIYFAYTDIDKLIFGKDFWIISTTIGRISIGWFIGKRVYELTYKDLQGES